MTASASDYLKFAEMMLAGGKNADFDTYTLVVRTKAK